MTEVECVVVVVFIVKCLIVIAWWIAEFKGS